jgi:hypothetical protein
MLLALVSARVASKRAQLTKPPGEVAAARHQCRSQATKVGTITIEADAVGHPRDVIFLKTGGRTVLTSVGTVLTGADTRRKFSMAHGATPSID